MYSICKNENNDKLGDQILKFGLGEHAPSLKFKEITQSFAAALTHADDQKVLQIIQSGAITSNFINPILLAIERKTPVALQALLEKLKEKQYQLLRREIFDIAPIINGCYQALIEEDANKQRWLDVFEAIEAEDVPTQLKSFLVLLLQQVKNLSKNVLSVAKKIKRMESYYSENNKVEGLKEYLLMDGSSSFIEEYLIYILYLAATLKIKNTEYQKSGNTNINLENCVNVLYNKESNDLNVNFSSQGESIIRCFMANVDEQLNAYLEIVHVFLNLNPDLNKETKINGVNYTSFILACFLDNKVLLDKILTKEIVIPSDILSLCVKQGFSQSVNALLATKKVNIFDRDSAGLNALDYAVQKNDEKLVEQLLEYAKVNNDLSYIRQDIYLSCLLIKKNETKQEIIDLLFGLLPQEAKFLDKKKKLAQDGSHYNIALQKLSSKQFSQTKSRYKFFKFKDNNREFIVKIDIDDWRHFNEATHYQAGKIFSRLSKTNLSNSGHSNLNEFFGPRIKRLNDKTFKIRPNGDKRLFLIPDPNAENENMLIGHFELKHK